MQPEWIHETNHHLFVRQVAYIAIRGLGQMFTSRQENVTASRQIITGSNFQSHTRTLARYSSIPPFCLSSGENWLRVWSRRTETVNCPGCLRLHRQKDIHFEPRSHHTN